MKSRVGMAAALIGPVLLGSADAQEALRGEPSLPGLDVRDLDASRLDRDRRAQIGQAIARRAYEQAQSLLVDEVERSPSPELLRLLGGVFFLRGLYLNSAIALKKAEALAPLDDRSRFTLAMAYVVMGRRGWARPELRKLAASDTRNPVYRYWLARLDYDDGLYAAAADGFRGVLVLDPAYMKAHDNLGLCYDALGRYDEAVASYREAIRLNREARTPSPWPPLNLGILLTRLGGLDEAEPLFREAVRIDPRFAQGHYQLGMALDKTGNAAEAIKELEDAARLDASYPDPHYALARLYRRTGDAGRADAALATFQRLKKEKGRTDPEPK